MTIGGDYAFNADQWYKEVCMPHDEQGAWEKSQATTAHLTDRDAFVDQVEHLMKMIGLKPRHFEFMIHAVFFDDSNENKTD